MNVQDCDDPDIRETLERADRRAQAKGDDHDTLPAELKQANVQAVRSEMFDDNWQRTMGRDFGILPRPGGCYRMTGKYLTWDPIPRRTPSKR